MGDGGGLDRDKMGGHTEGLEVVPAAFGDVGDGGGGIGAGAEETGRDCVDCFGVLPCGKQVGRAWHQSLASHPLFYPSGRIEGGYKPVALRRPLRTIMTVGSCWFSGVRLPKSFSRKCVVCAGPTSLISDVTDKIRSSLGN